jgi:hypothetical protein
MPDTNDAATEAEFTALLAELQAEQPDADSEGEEADPAADVDGDPEGEEPKPPQGDDDLDDEEPAEDAEELEETPEAASAAGIDEIAALLQAGDLKGAAKLLKVDPSIFKLNAKQFTAMRKGLADAGAAKKAAEDLSRAAAADKAYWEGIQTQAEAVYGPIVAGAKAYAQGEHLKAKAAIELIFKDSFENVVASVARAAKGLDPAQVEVLKLRRELEAEKAAKAAQEAQAQAAQTEKAQDAQILGKLKGTPLEGLDEAAAEIGKVVRASLDPRTGQYSKTVKEAYAEVKAAYAAKAAKLAKLAPKAPPSKTPAPARAPLAPVRGTAPKKAVTPEDKKAAEEAEFQAELAAAKRESAMQERRARRAH